MAIVGSFFGVTLALAGLLWLASVSIGVAFAILPFLAAGAVLMSPRRLAQTGLAAELVDTAIPASMDHPLGGRMFRDYAKKLPEIALQLRNTATEMEQELARIYLELDGIQRRANGNVADTIKALEATATHHPPRQSELEALVENSRTVFSESIHRIVKSSARALKVVYDLEDLQHNFEQLSRTVHVAVDKSRAPLAPGAAMLETVSAAAETPVGQGAAEVDDAWPNLKRKMDLITVELQQIAATDLSSVLVIHDSLEQSISALARENEQLRVASECAAQQEQSLSREVAEMLRGFRLEESIRQWLAELAPALSLAERELREIAARSDSADRINAGPESLNRPVTSASKEPTALIRREL